MILPRELINQSDGKVAIYDTTRKRWVRCFPVDAREQLKAGTGILDGPEDSEKAPVIVTSTLPPSASPSDGEKGAPSAPATSTPISGKSAPVQMPTVRKPG